MTRKTRRKNVNVQATDLSIQAGAYIGTDDVNYPKPYQPFYIKYESSSNEKISKLTSEFKWLKLESTITYYDAIKYSINFTHNDETRNVYNSNGETTKEYKCTLATSVVEDNPHYARQLSADGSRELKQKNIDININPSLYPSDSNPNPTPTPSYSIETYTITYELNGGSVTGNPDKYTTEQQTFTLKNPTRQGYTFIGWTGSNGTTPQLEVKIPFGSSGNKTYTANWKVATPSPTIETYTITYVLNGGSVTNNPDRYTTEQQTFTLNNPTKSGYVFTGWTGSNGSTPQLEVKIPIGSTGDKTYTANWELATYSIEYDYDGGNTAQDNPVEYTIETDSFVLNNPTKEGYTFLGWTGSCGNTPLMAITITKGTTGNKQYKANWYNKEDVDNNDYFIPDIYELDKEKGIFSEIDSYESVESLKSKILTKGTIKVLNKNGEELGNDAFVGTGCKIIVEFDNKTVEYNAVIIGDASGDGQVNVLQQKAIDLDRNDEMTLKDVSLMNQAIVGKTCLQNEKSKIQTMKTLINKFVNAVNEEDWTTVEECSDSYSLEKIRNYEVRNLVANLDTLEYNFYYGYYCKITYDVNHEKTDQVEMSLENNMYIHFRNGQFKIDFELFSSK